jgi:hypothetical protein
MRMCIENVVRTPFDFTFAFHGKPDPLTGSVYHGTAPMHHLKGSAQAGIDQCPSVDPQCGKAKSAPHVLWVQSTLIPLCVAPMVEFSETSEAPRVCPSERSVCHFEARAGACTLRVKPGVSRCIRDLQQERDHSRDCRGFCSDR